MIAKKIKILIKSDGSYLDTILPPITANEDGRTIVQVIAPFPITDIVSVNYSIRPIQATVKGSYLLPTGKFGKDVLDEDYTHFQTVADWNVFEIPINDVALEYISKYRAGLVLVSFAITQLQTPYFATNYLGLFSNTQPIPATSYNDGDYFIANEYNFTAHDITWAKGDYAYFYNGKWNKGKSVLKASTPSIELPVDPSLKDAPQLEYDEDVALLLANDLGLLTQRVSQAETDIESAENDINEIDGRVGVNETDIYNLESDVDDLETEIGNIKDGTTIIKKAEQDASGNVITSTYETKIDATSKLATKVDKTQKIIGIDLQDDILLTEFKTALGNATQSVAGLLSVEDKTHLDGLVALLESSDGNNVVDTIGEILAIFNNYPEGADLVTALNGKVDKVAGKALSQNDFTDALKNKLDGLLNGSQYYDKNYIDALKDKNGWESELLGTLSNNGTIDLSIINQYDEIQMYAKDTPGVIDNENIRPSLMQSGDSVYFFDDTKAFIMVDTVFGFYAPVGYTLQVVGIKYTELKASDVSFNDTVLELGATNVQTAIEKTINERTPTQIDTKIKDAGLNTPIEELNNHTLKEVFDGGNKAIFSNYTYNGGIMDLRLSDPSLTDLTGDKIYMNVYQPFDITSAIRNSFVLIYGDSIRYYESSVEDYKLNQGLHSFQYVLLKDLSYVSYWMHTITPNPYTYNNFVIINQTSLGISSLTVEQMDYWFNIYKSIKEKSTTQYVLEALSKRAIKAIDTTYDNIESGLQATNVQEVIDELSVQEITNDRLSELLFLGKNKFNPEVSIFLGTFIAVETGDRLNITGWNSSDYVPLEELVTYTINFNKTGGDSIGHAFYDEKKQFISGVNVNDGNTFTTPLNTKFARFSMNPDVENKQLEKGSQQTDYAPYKLAIDGSFIDLNVEDDVRIILPKEYVAVIGDTLQIFYRGIIEEIDVYKYNIRVTCSKGKGFIRYYEYTPIVGDEGVYTWNITLYDRNSNVVGVAQTNIRVVAKSAIPLNPVNVLCFGDSLTAGYGKWVQEFYRRLTGNGGTPSADGLSNINFIGTQNGGGGALHEGRSGWTWGTFINPPDFSTTNFFAVVSSHNKDGVLDQHSVWSDGTNNWVLEDVLSGTQLKFVRAEGNTANIPTGSGTLTHVSSAVNTEDIAYTSTLAEGGSPFYDIETQQLSFAKYCQVNNFNGIDVAMILLTWNGLSPDRATPEDHATLISQAKTLLNVLHADFPNCKVVIMSPQLPSLNGGMGSDYSLTIGYSNTFGNVRTIFGMNLAYKELENEVGYEYVEHVNVSGQFDSENNMPEIDVPVNIRSTKTEKLGTNGVHPSPDGYNQIADIAYRILHKKLQEIEGE